MFKIDPKALQYIQKKSGSVVIEMESQPSLGGWACSLESVTGRYVPKIYFGEPPKKHIFEFNTVEMDGIKVYYSQRIKVKDGHTGILVKLRNLLVFKWLELEGVRLWAKGNLFEFRLTNSWGAFQLICSLFISKRSNYAAVKYWIIKVVQSGLIQNRGIS